MLTPALTTSTRPAPPWSPSRAALRLPPADLQLPQIAASLPDGSTVQMPPVVWPTIAAKQQAHPGRPMLQILETTTAAAEELLIAWRHPLHLRDEEHPDGVRYTRPFGRLCFVLEVLGRPAAVVILASTVNASVSKQHGLHRYNVVDLARIGRSDEDPHVLRAMNRLTREYLAHEWPRRYPHVCPDGLAAIVSTSLPGTASSSVTGTDGLYRFDGFQRLRMSTGAKGGGRQNPSRANAIADGARGLWVYAYDAQLRTTLKNAPAKPPACAPRPDHH